MGKGSSPKGNRPARVEIARRSGEEVLRDAVGRDQDALLPARIFYIIPGRAV
jgi:hypothetical protein